MTDMEVNVSNAFAPSAPTTVAIEQPAATAQTDELQRRIFARIVVLTQGAPPPPFWVRFGRISSVRRLKGEPDQLLALLSAEFGDDVLVVAGLALRAQTGELRL